MCHFSVLGESPKANGALVGEMAPLMIRFLIGHRELPHLYRAGSASDSLSPADIVVVDDS